MPAHKRDHALCGGAVEPQAFDDELRLPGALLAVAVEVSDAPCVEREAGGLSDVVQQRRKPQRRLGGRLLDRVDQMRVDVEAVVRVALLEAQTGQQLRQRHAEHLGELHQNLKHVFAAQQLEQLRGNPLAADVVEQPAVAAHRGRRLRRDLEAEHRGEAQRPQNAQRVLAEAGVRHADAADHARAQVGLPAEVIGKPVVGMPRHRVDREVPPREIVAQLVCKAHAVRMAVVGVAAVDAVGRDLDGLPVQQHRDGAVLEPGGDHALRREDLAHLLGQGAGGQVEVLRRYAQQHITHAAADEPSLIARVVQPPQHGQRKMFVHGIPPRDNGDGSV